MVAYFTEEYTVKSIDVKNKLIDFTDYSGLSIEYCPNAKPGDVLIVTINAGRGSIISVVKKGR